MLDSNREGTMNEADTCRTYVLPKLNTQLAPLWELQSATGEELSALLPSVLDKAFKGELR